MEKILSSSAVAPLVLQFGRDAVKQEAGSYLASFRAGSEERPPGFDGIAAAVRGRLEQKHAPSLRAVINATGVILHTNLGRAPVSANLWQEAGGLVEGYSNLELDLETGKRGARENHVAQLAAELFGAEAAIVVNNNAAAVLLVLAALASRKEVLVSRSELVEIGGAFRVPDVIEQGGARLREVGTTNRTRAADFAEAITKKTGALLRVHQSNFQIVGFTESPEVGELVAVARKAKIPLVIDEGSGRVVDLSRFGFSSQPTVRELLSAGVDIVTCSTDKLLGSVQGGLILGRRELISRCAKHPLMRALRVGKDTYALLSATLQTFIAGKHEAEIPIYRMLSMPLETLRERASRIAAATEGAVVETRSPLGGGTTPTETIASYAVGFGGSPSDRFQALLALPSPVLARISDDTLLLDLRTVDPKDDERLIELVLMTRRA